ncbi:hypothetical protein QFZ24_000701 [Streptomyces phaeochromogenes]|jgi:hypothetical protein|nr:hypothetical protein [Streptomyces phaeochromogenes]MDQ0946778.1 hypothetical protein [Streptomyces phaeochromogenes]
MTRFTAAALPARGSEITGCKKPGGRKLPPAKKHVHQLIAT